jgi:hypothetical protein
VKCTRANAVRQGIAETAAESMARAVVRETVWIAGKESDMVDER